MGVYPELIEIKHQSYVFDGTTDEHGIPIGHLADPVTRHVFTVYQVDWAQPHPDPISVEYLDRTIVEIMIMTSDPQNYKKLDRVLIFNGTEWLAYEVMNQSISWGPGYPWQKYGPLFGGEVHGRRVN